MNASHFWPKDSAKALIPIVLTALGAVGYQAAVYAFYTGPNEGAAVRIEVERFKQKMQVIDHLESLNQVTDEMLDHSRKRVDVLKSLMPVDMRNKPKVHAAAMESLSTANRDLGLIQGRSPLPEWTSNVRSATIDELTSEIATWDLLRDYSAPHQTKSWDYIARERFDLSFIAEDRTLAALESAWRDLKPNMVKIRTDLDLWTAEQHNRERDNSRKTFLAYVALVSALALWAFAFVQLFKPDAGGEPPRRAEFG